MNKSLEFCTGNRLIKGTNVMSCDLKKKSVQSVSVDKWFGAYLCMLKEIERKIHRYRPLER